MVLLRQGGQYMLVGLAQLLLDWAAFVVATAMGIPAAPGNVIGRTCGALLGFWLNGRYTFARAGQQRLGWARFCRFLVLWLALTALSTLLVSATAHHLGMQWAWLAKPLVEGGLALLSFVLMRQLVYR